MKLNKQDTKDYIKLQLPIIKGELQQANNKINTYITFWGIVMSFCIGALAIMASDDSITWISITTLSLTAVIMTAAAINIFRLIYKLKSRLQVEYEDVKDQIDPKDVDIYFFGSYTKVSFKTYASMFTTTNKHDKNALLQIYKNSLIVVKRY